MPTLSGVLALLPDNNTGAIDMRDDATSGHILVRPASLTNPAGATAQRPVNPPTGFMFFDTTLGIPLWFNDGSGWVDATGASV